MFNRTSSLLYRTTILLAENLRNTCQAVSLYRGTISQAVRTCEVRSSHHPRLSITALQHLLTATALNLLRMGTRLTGEPLAQALHARFDRLYRVA
jgi:hypothetical protein